MIRRLLSPFLLSIASLVGVKDRARAMSVPGVPAPPVSRGRGKHSNNHFAIGEWARRKRRRAIARASRTLNRMRAKGKR